jgi:nicotinate-nucleotide adenylyltransferase
MVVASEVRHRLGLARVLWVVAGVPWQKVDGRPISPAEVRLAMVEAAIAGIEGFEVCDLEVRRPGLSFTADTLVELAGFHPDAMLHLIVGADAASGLGSWERADEVARRCVLVIVNRPGQAVPDLDPEWTVRHVEMPAIDLSSTDLRSRIADGVPCNLLVPDGALRIARERGLYRS